MASRGKAAPFLTLLLAAVFVAGVPAPARPARAETAPPFNLEFPQESSVTIFSSTFGASRSGGRRHDGNDLMAPKLTPVYAAADGVVVTIDSSSLGGRYVEIQHAAGWSSRYMHLNNDDPGTDNGAADWSLTVVPGLVVGSHVDAGQQIAYVGDSGNAEWTGSHTHFELAFEGGAIDPYPLLKDAYARAQEIRAAAMRASLRFGEDKLA
jgi:murein DD-endopeptidase MepM/ murein hydrolase activator NlpD